MPHPARGELLDLGAQPLDVALDNRHQPGDAVGLHGLDRLEVRLAKAADSD